ncbi:hypothetical protein H8B15_05305 [Hymenobacter sp. BT507]|uniref:Outer membrane protein beta-barrel domain-containing protein n=1 Tax=Hymenobacter citatus TaxID=2763506 RepID=A0ABR7MGW8_9BACT|nr:hypothetical protein [Hymenobacter citatus]MBC6610325.1 hypothetical protein [Hymenobacter citatus]
MSTPDDLSDNELDALFQRSAASYPELDGQEGWQRMTTRLDTEMQVQRERASVVRLFGAETLSLLILLLGSFYIVDAFWGSDDRCATATPTATSIDTSQRRPASTSRLSGVTRPTSSASAAASATASSLVAPVASSLPTPAAPTLAESPNPIPAGQPGSAEGAAALPRQQRVPSRVANRKEYKRTASAARLRNVHSQPVAAASVAHAPDATSRPGASASVAEAPTPSSVAAATAPSSMPAPTAPGSDSLVVQAVPLAVAAADSVAPPTRPEKLGKPAYRFGVGLVYAPEVSTVRFAQATRPGSNVGVLLEYRATARWRITTGLIRSVKLYEARGSDYHAPAGFWTTRYDIDEVYANCRILDIPVNMRFDALVRPRYAVFTSAGLSTLFMRRETYDYDYYLQGQSVSREWTLKNGSNHPFSVLNLSAGYERTLGGRWSGQAEPFVKLPLGGVGFGKVKLSSAGVFFSLKYQLLPTATQPVR